MGGDISPVAACVTLGKNERPCLKNHFWFETSGAGKVAQHEADKRSNREPSRCANIRHMDSSIDNANECMVSRISGAHVPGYKIRDE